jgi:hypothetical protein
MCRDIVARLKNFGVEPIFTRIALNIDQIEQYNPPPNPTKLTDSRANGYISEFGEECWELDALRPEAIDKLITDAVEEYVDTELFSRMKTKEENARQILSEVSNDWDILEDDYREKLGIEED